MTRRAFLKLAWVNAAAFIVNRAHLAGAATPAIEHWPNTPTGKVYPLIYPATYVPEPTRAVGDKKFKLLLMFVPQW
jgi:hypothetical protein